MRRTEHILCGAIFYALLRLILTERTTIVTRDGRTQNGSLLYTILPIQLVIEQFYQEQFKAADIAREQQRIEKLMVQRNTAY